MALRLFPIHFVEGYFLSLLIWNASIIISLCPICVWVCRFLIPEALWFPPTCLHSCYSLSEIMLLSRIVLHLYINLGLINGFPLTILQVLLETGILFCLSLISWECFNLFFRWIIYFYFVWFVPRQFVLFGCCHSRESFSSIILSNQVVFCTMLLKYDYSLFPHLPFREKVIWTLDPL